APRAHRDLPPLPTRRSSDLQVIDSFQREPLQRQLLVVFIGALTAEPNQPPLDQRDNDRGDSRNQGDNHFHVRSAPDATTSGRWRSEEHTSELQSRENLVCRL